jgi:uncharacterized protein
MDQTEQHYIDELFDRLQSAERQSGPRDAGAEGYIRERVSRQPAAPYYMAQAIIVQEEALKAAQQRIAELEHEIEQRPAQAAGSGGGFLGGLFGGGPARTTSVPPSSSVPSGGSVPRAGGGFNYPREQRPPMDQRAQAEDSTVARYGQTGRGGGFLAGAMQTAVGVAGGVVLGNMIGNMLGGDKAGAAQAGEAAKPEAAEAGKNEPAAQEASNTADQGQPDDPFANVEEAEYDDDDSFIGGDFGGGGFDI